LARRSLKPQLNQIRTWVRQGRTDAWIAHQLEVSVKDIGAFKREHELAPAEVEGDAFGPLTDEQEPDLRAEDEALVAAALEAELEQADGEDGSEEDTDAGSGEDGDDDGDDKPRPGDHGEEGYGLWLDPAIQDDGVYAEHWAGHRAVTVTVEQDRIVIARAGEDAGGSDGD
jgi:hypothetical protein